MKKITHLFLIFFALASLGASWPQDGNPEPYLLGSTKPLHQDYKTAALDFLWRNPPANPAPVYYFISNVSVLGQGMYRVSMIAYDLESPYEEFDLEMHDKITWFGALNITQVGEEITVSYFTLPHQQSALKRAAPRAAGGGANVWFPWQANKSVIYGVLGVHDDGYAGQKFVDLVSGDALGPNAAHSNVYASTQSTIVAICDDEQTVGLRLQTVGDESYYSYYHLLPSETFVEGRTYAKGALIGSLKYGSFESQGCGSAQQQATNYHLHWGFQPANNKFRAEDCILDLTTQKWDCTQNGIIKQISPGSWLWHANGGDDVGVIINDNGTVVVPSSPSFFDMVVIGLYTVLQNVLIAILPAKTAFDTAGTMSRVAIIVIHMFYVLVRSTFDIRLAINIFLAIAVIETGLALFSLYRLILKAIPTAS